MILDLHIHSKYSFDSFSEIDNIMLVARRKGLNGIAITDHNTIRGGIEAEKINKDADFLVIVGCEISTEIGDVIGLFLNEEIKSRCSKEVFGEIHRQGGIVVLPHPYKGHKLSDEIMKNIDAVEGFNSRTSEEDNKKAMKLAEQYKKHVIAGSDAHFYREIGASRVIVNSKDVKNEILNGRLKLETTKTPLYMESLSQMIKSIKLGKYVDIPVQFMWFIRNALERK